MVNKLIDTFFLILEKSFFIQAVLFIVSCVLIFTPSSILEKIYLSHEAIKNWLPFVSIIMLICGTFLVLTIIKFIWNNIKVFFQKRANNKQILETLKGLMEEEKIILWYLVYSNDPSVSTGYHRSFYLNRLAERGVIERLGLGIGNEKYALPEDLCKFSKKHRNKIFPVVMKYSQEEFAKRFKDALDRSMD